MDKIFINAQDLLEDSFQLAADIYDSGFKPDFIIGVWRGGTPVGICVQEYLEYKGVKTDHISIRTSSYYGLDKQSKTIRVHGLEYIIENVNADDSLLIVDDVFDSGRSIRALLNELSKKTRRNLPQTIKIACPWFKPNKNVTDITPDYYIHETEQWLVFPHELDGLSIEEIKQGKPALAKHFDDS